MSPSLFLNIFLIPNSKCPLKCSWTRLEVWRSFLISIRVLGWGGRNKREKGRFNPLNLETHPDQLSPSGSRPAWSLCPKLCGAQPFAVPSQVTESVELLTYICKFFDTPPIIKRSLIPKVIYFYKRGYGRNWRCMISEARLQKVIELPTGSLPWNMNLGTPEQLCNKSS